MKKLIILLLIVISSHLYGQSISLKRGDKTKSIDTEQPLRFKGENEKYSDFYYKGIVIENTRDSLKVRISFSSTRTRDTNIKTRIKYNNYSTAKDVTIAKNNVEYIYTKNQSRVSNTGMLATLGFAITGAGTLVYGAITNNETTSLIGLGQLGLSLIAGQIYRKCRYKISASKNLKNSWNLL